MLVRYIDDMTKRSDDLFGGLMEDLFGKWKTTTTTSEAVKQSLIMPVPGQGLRSYRATADEKGMTLEVDLPGISITNVSFWASGNQLTVKASKGENKYTNRYAISDDYDINTAKASMAHGQLTIKIGRSSKADPRRIDIAQG